MTAQDSLALDTPYDALIVGGGMAGLLAAHELLRRSPRARVLVADAGLPLDERLRHAAGQMGGSGGAGLYLGGRLYLGPASIPAPPPGTAPAGFHTIVAGAAYERQARAVNALLNTYGARAPIRHAPDQHILDAIAAAKSTNLEYVTSYPARFLTEDERRVTLRQLLRGLEDRGVVFSFSTRATPEDFTGSHFRVRLDSVGDTTGHGRIAAARALLLAPGRYGAEWLVETARRLGAHVTPLPSAFGVRLEVPAAAYAPLTGINPDPRIQRMLLEDAIIKTYATCPGGRVVPITRYGALVASGIPLPMRERTANTTFAVLVQPGIEGAAAIWREGESVASRLNQRYPGHLVVQRLDDLRRRLPSTPDTLARGSILPTCPEAIPGALHDVYPAAFWRAFEDFMGRLAQLAPGIQADDALVYGPAEERFWLFPTGDLLQTTAPGLFVAGDGAGQSQGIIQAGVTGLLAGAGLAAHLARA